MQDFLVFDLETQRSALDVGGWDHIPEMRMSVGVLYDSRDQSFYDYYDTQAFDLIAHLSSGPLVIGYNHLSFDYSVLSGYAPLEERAQLLARLTGLRNLDLLVSIKEKIGKRIKLDDLVRPTLGAAKSADGLLALEWYRQYLEGEAGMLEKITEYCRQDVTVTRDLFLHGKTHGKVSYLDKERGLTEVAVDWPGLGALGHDPEGTMQLPLF
ncbi:MAG: hypothetical protein A2600_01425 [Candidatus Lambdaproteobacteria bacterium RIFOXYD1_FULL_56_27]|uniref:YprB ribonuclease H-like domain-containing protein n=1 Tax=Candidatus Lambdaproteobacteria bacterium RIFOXYD2_FULL_56_26 TaxID=1817773 RepID=A0A1F6GSW6_9PROT|nr:MAG: hypothetical protein A2557_00540 [Candidatus Lambdaproteobacteria bacterium RIFOXYD2_FULL_56_26]OGH01394.1 MAG: hypothetical protein A2426_13375 [Candidatus Lambdaproteobacteria bacterium RIFOXYC1_FULL_56_13]OGH06935.1 MAG: hypothetical protein A2600_01425 [Candidatus Lambdaproteobacteria bacterium RIFOXYD1_FULL_56_27]